MIALLIRDQLFFDVVVQEKSNAWEGSGGGGEGVRDGHVCIYSKQ